MPERARILIVDDEADLRTIVSVGLSREGHEVVEADDGIAALEELNRQVPSLVLLDLHMPRMDGYELLRRIRAENRWMAMPVVILSGQHRQEDVLRGLSLGADEYLFKPVELWELKARVASLLRIAKLRHRVVALEREKTEAQMRLAGQVCIHMMNSARDLDGYFELERHGATGERLKLVDAMAQRARHLVQLLDAMAEYAQLAPSAVETLQLKEVIALAAAGCEPDWRATGHLLDVALPADLPSVRGRKFELGLAFRELLARAARAMPTGGTVRVHGAMQAGEIAIAVQDSGSGSAESEELLEVEPFAGEGGQPMLRRMTLQVASSILAQHQARLEVKAVPGTGTTVTVVLPV
jgi:two-component system sensor histidine kinase/response regulator